MKPEHFLQKETQICLILCYFRIPTKYICMKLFWLICDLPVPADPGSWLDGAGDMISDDVRMFPINLVSVNPSVSGDWAPLQPQILQLTKLEWSKTRGILVSRISAFCWLQKEPKERVYLELSKGKSRGTYIWRRRRRQSLFVNCLGGYQLVMAGYYLSWVALTYHSHLTLSIMQYLVEYKNCTRLCFGHIAAAAIINDLNILLIKFHQCKTK